MKRSEIDLYHHKVSLLREQVDQIKQTTGYSLPKYIKPIIDEEKVVHDLMSIRKTIDSFLDLFVDEE